MWGAIVDWVKGLFGVKTTQYSCPYDSKKFKTVEELNAHIKSKHPGKRQVMVVNWS